MARTTPSYAIILSDGINNRKVSVAPFPNLVDNAWFTINQLGATTLPTSSTTPWIDRWRWRSKSSGAGGNITWTTDGLQCNVTGTSTDYIQIYQKYAESRFVTGLYYRVSIMLSTGDIYSSPFLCDSAAHYIGGVNAGYFGLILAPSYITLRVYGKASGMTVRALKVEGMGSEPETRGDASANDNCVATSIALEHDPDYQSELLKCQRYMYVVQPMGSNTEAAVGFASNNGTGGQFNIGVSVPAAMAKVPKLLFSNGTYANFYVNVQGVDYACTATPTISTMSSPNLPVIVGTFNTTSKVFSLAYMKNSGVLILDAENY